MDWLTRKQSVIEHMKKMRFMLLFVCIGLLLMLLPEKEPSQIPQESSAQIIQPDLQQSLEKLLGQVAGVGKVQVLLSQEEGEKVLYQTDENKGGDNLRSSTVLVTDGQRQETGLVVQKQPPTYKGAVIVCQGGDSASVRLAIVQAVTSAVGIGADCVTVLKMK